jgi:hypothetical protein
VPGLGSKSGAGLAIAWMPTSQGVPLLPSPFQIDALVAEPRRLLRYWSQVCHLR